MLRLKPSLAVLLFACKQLNNPPLHFALSLPFSLSRHPISSHHLTHPVIILHLILIAPTHSSCSSPYFLPSSRLEQASLAPVDPQTSPAFQPSNHSFDWKTTSNDLHPSPRSAHLHHLRPSTMRAFNLALGLVALPLAFAGDAPVVEGNPIGTQYIAVLPDKNNTSVRGAVAINTNSNGTGANVQISISGLPAKDGPYSKQSLQYTFGFDG